MYILLLLVLTQKGTQCVHYHLLSWRTAFINMSKERKTDRRIRRKEGGSKGGKRKKEGGGKDRVWILESRYQQKHRECTLHY